MMPEGAYHQYSLAGLKPQIHTTKITMSPRFDSLNKWRRTESAVVEAGYTLSKPNRYDIATVRSPRRNEASGIGGDRPKEDTHHAHPKAQYHHGSAAGMKGSGRKWR